MIKIQEKLLTDYRQTHTHNPTDCDWLWLTVTDCDWLAGWMAGWLAGWMDG